MAPYELADRVVVITGASSGIGRATARQLAIAGSNLVLVARSATSLHHARAECLRDNPQAAVIVVPTDVSDDRAVTALFDRARVEFGRVDAVVHAAAVVAYGRFEQVPAHVFDQVLRTNILGTVHVARAALAEFTTRGEGRLVLVGSLLGKIAAPFMSSYVTGKWAIHGLTRALQLEARETPGIAISLVSPGGVDTPVYANAANYFSRQGRPPPPVDPPEKVAGAIVRALRKPRREISVGIANPLVVLGFRAFPGLYDLLVVPLMKIGGLSRTEVPANTGNVLEPNPAGDSAHGKWGRHWLRVVTGGVVGGGAAVGAVFIGRRRI